MQKNISQQHMVPTVFWAEVTPLDPDNDVTDALVQFNRLMHKNDMSEITTTQNLVITALEKQCKDRIQELTNAHKATNEIFNAVARMYAGNVLASAENMATKESIRKELSVYFGVIGAKKTLSLTRSPEGFKAAKLFDVLIAMYETLGSRPNSVIDNESVGYHSSDSQSPRNNIVSDRRNAVHSQTRTQVASHGRTSEDSSTRTPDASEETYTRTQDASDQKRIDGTSRRSLAEQRSPPIIRIDSDDETSVTHDMLPEFEYSDRDIPITERRNALKIVKKITHPDGPFVGVKDKRQVRTLLIWLKAKAKSQFLTIVEYAALLDASLSIEIQHMVPENTCRTYRELHEDVLKRINGLLLQFGATPEAERSKNRTRFANIRQNIGEELSEYVARFDSLLFDLDASGIKLEKTDTTERFVESLHPVNQQEARLLRFARTSCDYYTLKNELLSMKRPGLRHKSATYEGHKSATSDGISCRRCGGAHKIDDCAWKADVECRNCGRPGHLAKVCRQPKQENREQKPTSFDSNRPNSSVQNKKQACVIEISTIEKRDNDNRPHLPLNMGGHDLLVLLDSGAECNVISKTLFESLKHSPECRVEEAHPIKIRSACNKDVISDKEIHIQVKHDKKRVTIPFRLYPPLKREAIIGVNGLQALGATLRFRKTDDSDYSEIPPATEIYSLSNEELIQVVDELQPPPTESYSEHRTDLLQYNPVIEWLERTIEFSSFLQPLPSSNIIPTLLSNIDASLSAICEGGLLSFSPHYQIKLTRLSANDKKDVESQQYRFTVVWALHEVEDADTLPRLWNSSKAIEKLNAKQQSEWNTHISGYLTTDWWVPIKKHVNDHLAAVVFPVCQDAEKTTTVRPCSDFRRLNKFSPPISANTPSTEDAVLKLRSVYDPTLTVRQYDLAKAFYKIETQIFHHQQKFVPTLRVGNNNYQSQRLVFGLSCGPAALNATQDILNFVISKVAATIARLTCIIVMDDYLLIGTPEAVELYEQLLDHAWNRTGFDSPTSKRTRWSEVPTRWLGGYWSIDPNGLSLRRPEQRLVLQQPVTKRKVFAEAGKIMAFIGSLNETISRTHCDALRAIAGKTAQWDGIIEDKTTLSLLQKHIDQANSYHERAISTETTVPTLSNIRHMAIETDASNTGYGMVCSSENQILFTVSKIFSASQQIWHINRKELYALALCLQRCDAVIIHLRHLTEVTILSDSRVALLQLNEYLHYNSKSIDKRVLLRLRQNVFDLWHQWRRMGIVVDARHIPGNENRADQLTRIIESNAKLDELLVLDMSHDPDTTKNAIRLAQATDPKVQSARGATNFYYTDPDGLVRFKTGKLYIPQDIAIKLLTRLHEEAGHLQLRDLLFNFQQCCFSPHARQLAKKVIRTCGACALSSNTTDGQTTYGPIRQPEFPFETLGIDLFGPLIRPNNTSQKEYILTIVDRLTGYTQFIVLPDSSSSSVCRVLDIFMVTIGHRTRSIITDNGRQFTDSDEFRHLLALSNIQHVTIPIYAPHAGGFYETKHRTAVHVLRTMLFDHPHKEWQYLATIASQQINSRTSADRSCSPHELIFGYPHSWPTMTSITNITTETEAVPPERVVDVQSKRHQLREQFLDLWKTEFELRQTRSATRFYTKTPKSRPPLQIGDHVMFTNDTIKRKFAPQCTGPFLLISPNGQQSWHTVEIHTGRKFLLHSRRLRFIDPENSLVTPTPPHDITTTIDPIQTPVDHTPEHPREAIATDDTAPTRTDNVTRVQFNDTPTTRLFEPDSPPNSPLTILPHPSGYNLRSRIKANTTQTTKYHALH